ncbi:MAG: 7TM diverse intracellular signaling domain-containing protein [Chromatiaceae bacterium]
MEAALLFASLAVMLTVMLLALNHWFWLRDPLSPWFLGYVGCLFLNLAATAGFVGQFLLPEAPDLANHWVRLSALGAIACGNGFYRLLFRVDPGQRVLQGLYWAGIWVPLALIPLTFMGYQTEVMPPVLNFVVVMNGVGLYLSTRLWRRREPGGGFMLIANLISMLGLLAQMLLC